MESDLPAALLRGMISFSHAKAAIPIPLIMGRQNVVAAAPAELMMFVHASGGAAARYKTAKRTT